MSNHHTPDRFGCQPHRIRQRTLEIPHEFPNFIDDEGGFDAESELRRIIQTSGMISPESGAMIIDWLD